MLLLIGQLLLLIFIANGAPVLAARLLGNHLSLPVDLGAVWFDGQRYLGDAKTWRGVFASLLLTSLAAPLLGISMKVGLAIACGAMAGDMISSLIKRRLKIRTSGQALGLDQIPESLLPLLAVQVRFNLEIIHVVIIVAAFLFIGLGVSKVLYRYNIRTHPY